MKRNSIVRHKAQKQKVLEMSESGSKGILTSGQISGRPKSYARFSTEQLFSMSMSALKRLRKDMRGESRKNVDRVIKAIKDDTKNTPS